MTTFLSFDVSDPQTGDDQNNSGTDAQVGDMATINIDADSLNMRVSKSMPLRMY